MTSRPPFGPRNRNQRVHDRACVACGDPVYRAPRGPAPRWCLACDSKARRRRQLRAYLRCAGRIAEELELSRVAAMTNAAVALFDEMDSGRP